MKAIECASLLLFFGSTPVLAQQTQTSPRATLTDSAAVVDPDLLPSFGPAPLGVATGEAPPTEGLVLSVVGADTQTNADMFRVANHSLAFVREVRWSLENVEGAFWDFDGLAGFGDGRAPVLAEVSGMAATSIRWSGWPAGDVHPTVLIATLQPPMPPGASFAFGADTDFFKSDPCPGSCFGELFAATASATTSPGLQVENVAFQSASDLASFAALGVPSEVLIDFETADDLVTPLSNGQVLSAGSPFGTLFTLEGFGLDNYGATLFDSTPAGPNATSSDQDLLVDQGNLLILQENGTQSLPGVFDFPDDAQRGGLLVFGFLSPVELRSIDLVDLCPGPPSQDVQLVLTDGLGRSRVYSVPGGWTDDASLGGTGVGTLDLTTLDPQPGETSVATASEDADFNRFDVTRLEVQLSSSGALDNLVLDTAPPPPLCLDCIPGVEEQFFSGSSGTGRAIYFTVDSSFRIDSVGIRFGLIAQNYEVLIYEGQGVGAPAGPVLASATGFVGGLGVAWYDLPIDFEFQAGQDYLLNWRPADVIATFSNPPDPYFSWGNAIADDFQVGPITMRDGREGYDATSIGNTVAPHMRMSFIETCPDTNGSLVAPKQAQAILGLTGTGVAGE